MNRATPGYPVAEVRAGRGSNANDAPHDGPDGELTNVPCRRSRSRPPCYGDVYARLAPDDRIEWRCRACGEEGVIPGWKGTRWERSGR